MPILLLVVTELPLITFRSAAVTPPIRLFGEPSISTPARVLRARSVPFERSPIMLPMMVFPVEVTPFIAMPLSPLYPITLRSVGELRSAPI